VLSVVTDDLLIGERQGYRVVDMSRPLDCHSREFYLKVVLLYVQGDYPAQSISCGLMHSGKPACHYCLEEGVYVRGINRVVFRDYYRWLPPGHPLRKGRTETAPPPRTAASVRLDGLENEGAVNAYYQNIFDKKGSIKDSTRETQRGKHIRGVKWFCPLSLLYLFDVIWDFVYDMMHGLHVFPRNIIPVMKGERTANQPKILKTETYEGDELKRRKDENRQAWAENLHALKVYSHGMIMY